MNRRQTKPNFQQNRFKEVTKPVEVKEERHFPFVQTALISLLAAALLVALNIWLH